MLLRFQIYKQIYFPLTRKPYPKFQNPVKYMQWSALLRALYLITKDWLEKQIAKE